MLADWDTSRLVAESDAVVDAVVISHASQSPDGRNILTETQLAVQRYWVGRGARQVTVTQHGGVFGGRSMWIPGSPSVGGLAPGSRVVVFLKRGGDRLWVTGMALGVYEVVSGLARRSVPVPVAAGHVLYSAGFRDRALPLRELRKEIEQATPRGRARP